MLIIVTKTVDKLIAKQITAGENIIQIKVVNLKYFRAFIFSNINFPISSSKAVNIAMNGDMTIAVQRIHILIIKIIPTTISGIPMAIKCHSSSTIANRFKNQESHVLPIIFLPDVIKDEYNCVNTHT
ncbi:hypothetical protein IKI14_02390 [bacterium]|nr:hypothetical protein [bacterium]